MAFYGISSKSSFIFVIIYFLFKFDNINLTSFVKKTSGAVALLLRPHEQIGLYVHIYCIIVNVHTTNSCVLVLHKL